MRRELLETVIYKEEAKWRTQDAGGSEDKLFAIRDLQKDSLSV